MEAALNAQKEMNEQLLKEVHATRAAIGSIITILDRDAPGTADRLREIFVEMADQRLKDDPAMARAISAVAEVMKPARRGSAE